MKYYCPCCKTEMKAIYCECPTVAECHLYWQNEILIHGNCGLPLSPEAVKGWTNKDSGELTK